jgi:hypothetical protein
VLIQFKTHFKLSTEKIDVKCASYVRSDITFVNCCREGKQWSSSRSEGQLEPFQHLQDRRIQERRVSMAAYRPGARNLSDMQRLRQTQEYGSRLEVCLLCCVDSEA